MLVYLFLSLGASEQVKPKFMKPLPRKVGEDDFGGEKRYGERREGEC